MSKLKVGDRVVVVNRYTVFTYRHGEVIGFEDDQDFPIKVLFDGDYMEVCFTGDELEFEHVYDELSKKSVVIQLNDNSFFNASEVVSSDDTVSHPSHYTSHPSGVECKDVIGHYPFFIGSAMKYLWRAGLKTEDPIEDLRKAMKNIEFEIQRLGGEA